MFAKRPQASASVHKRPQAFAKRSRRVGHAGETNETKIVVKRRTIVTFYVSHYKSVNSHSDRGGRARETQNCRHFWTRLGSSRLKSVNSHRDRGGHGREAQNCRHFWTRLGSSRLKSVNSVTGIGGVVDAEPRIVVTCGLVWGVCVSKMSTVTGIGGVVLAKRRTVVTFGLVSGVSVFQKCQQSQGSGGSCSRNAELSSLVVWGVCVSTVSTVTGIGRVVVAKPRTVVTLGFVWGVCVSKVSTVTGIGGVVLAKPRTVVTFGLVSGVRVSKVSTVSQGSGGSWS